MKPFLSSCVRTTTLREENPLHFPSSKTPLCSPWGTISPPQIITSQSSPKKKFPLKYKRDLELYQHPPDERVGGRTTSASRTALLCPSSAQVCPPCLPLCWVQRQHKLNVVIWPWQGVRRGHPPLGKSQGTAQVGQGQSSIPDPLLQDQHQQHHQHSRHVSDQILWQSRGY